MARKGKSLEQLTSALEKYIAEGNASVESPGYVPDRVTGQKREVDVLITKGVGHHKQLIAIECKDRKTPVGVPDIEAFHTKINDLHVTKAVFVSSSGFRQTAIKKAKFYNISCLDIDEVENCEWLLTDCIHCYEKKLLKGNWTIHTNDNRAEGIKNLVLVDKEFGEITIDVLSATSKKIFNELDFTDCELGKVYGGVYPINNENLYLLDKGTGEEYEVDICEVYLEYEINCSDVPLRVIKYGDITEGSNIASAAVAEVTYGNKGAHLMMVEQGDGSKQIVLVPNK